MNKTEQLRKLLAERCLELHDEWDLRDFLADNAPAILAVMEAAELNQKERSAKSMKDGYWEKSPSEIELDEALAKWNGGGDDIT